MLLTFSIGKYIDEVLCPWKLNMCYLGDLGNMIEMLSTMGLPIDILSCIKVKR